MNLREAILRTLEENGCPMSATEVHKYISDNNYYDFKDGATPANSVSSRLGDFERDNDVRVKRMKHSGGKYLYYLAKDENNIGIYDLANENELKSNKKSSVIKKETFQERKLHMLLSSYLKSTGIYSKTIFHEQSNGKESNQIWTHPDMVGVKFLKLQTESSQKFLRTVNRVDSFKISSYEIKTEINSDSELKKAFFQAVSNSSWANYGYLVAFEFSDSLNEEMARLNQAFGIGIIQIKAYPYESKLLFPSNYRDLDFKTIDKLCKMSGDFKTFIEHVDRMLTSEEKWHKMIERELVEFCDSCFEKDIDIRDYCEKNHIPIAEELEKSFEVA